MPSDDGASVPSETGIGEVLPEDPEADAGPGGSRSEGRSTDNADMPTGLFSHLTAWVKGSPSLALSIVGLIGFLVYREVLVVYYGKFGVRPEDVGLDYLVLLRTQAAGAAWVAFLAAIVTIFVVQRRRIASDFEIAELKQELFSTPENSEKAAGIHYAITKRKRSINAGPYYASLAVALVVVAWVVTAVYMANTATVGPREPSLFSPLQAEAVPVSASWESIGDGRLRLTPVTSQRLEPGYSGICNPKLLMLGTDGTDAVLYSQTLNKTFFINRDSIIVGNLR